MAPAVISPALCGSIGTCDGRNHLKSVAPRGCCFLAYYLSRDGALQESQQHAPHAPEPSPSKHQPQDLFYQAAELLHQQASSSRESDSHASGALPFPCNTSRV